MKCPSCAQPRFYVEQWDAFACLNCNKWLEHPCTCEPGQCPYAERPLAPAPYFQNAIGGSPA